MKSAASPSLRERIEARGLTIVGTKTLRKGSGLGTRWIIFYKPLGYAGEVLSLAV